MIFRTRIPNEIILTSRAYPRPQGAVSAIIKKFVKLGVKYKVLMGTLGFLWGFILFLEKTNPFKSTLVTL